LLIQARDLKIKSLQDRIVEVRNGLSPEGVKGAFREEWAGADSVSGGRRAPESLRASVSHGLGQSVSGGGGGGGRVVYATDYAKGENPREQSREKERTRRQGAPGVKCTVNGAGAHDARGRPRRENQGARRVSDSTRPRIHSSSSSSSSRERDAALQGR